MIIRGYSAGIEENIKRPATCFDRSIKVVSDIDIAFKQGVERLVFVGSSCMYPVHAPQPYKESCLGLGKIEETSESHAYANYAAMAQCKAYSKQFGVHYFTAIQADVYGDPNSSHFIGQIMRRMHLAKERGDKDVVIWGDGTALREPLYHEDAERLIGFVHENYDGIEPINLGTGKEFSVAYVAMCIKELIGYRGTLTFDCAMPAGARRKALDNSKILAMGFEKFTSLTEGLEKTYSNLINSL